MKTTLDLPDDLLIEAKTLAARGKTTLKAIVESTLRREIRPAPDVERIDPDRYERGPFGMLSLKPRTTKVTAEHMQQLIERQYDEEDATTIFIAKGNGGSFATFDTGIDVSLVFGGKQALLRLNQP